MGVNVGELEKGQRPSGVSVQQIGICTVDTS